MKKINLTQMDKAHLHDLSGQLPPTPNEPALIMFRTTPTDQFNKQTGEPIFKKDYQVNGPEETLFCMLCEAIDMNPQFRKLVEGALRFYQEHDRVHCPWCQAGKGN